jgi:hypothetical protein
MIVFSVDDIRKDLIFQLETPEDLDWDYFLETAMRAKTQADMEMVNMVEYEREVEGIINDAKVCIVT